MPTITKKWKCISITPPLSPTSTADDVTNPKAVIADTNLRRCGSVPANTANTATMPAPSRDSVNPRPTMSPKQKTPSTWARNRYESVRCRTRQTSSLNDRPRGNHASNHLAHRAGAPRRIRACSQAALTAGTDPWCPRLRLNPGFPHLLLFGARPANVKVRRTRKPDPAY